MRHDVSHDTAVVRSRSRSRITFDRLIIRCVLLIPPLAALQLLATAAGLHAGLVEGNPLLAAASDRWGFAGLVLGKLLISGLVACCLLILAADPPYAAVLPLPPRTYRRVRLFLAIRRIARVVAVAYVALCLADALYDTASAILATVLHATLT